MGRPDKRMLLAALQVQKRRIVRSQGVADDVRSRENKPGRPWRLSPVFGGPFPEIAVLNRMARNAEPGPARNAIVARRGDSRYAAAR
jgi:hypothetical protein